MFGRFIAVFITLTAYPSISLCQTLTATSSDITNVIRGLHYRIDPKPTSQSPITPADNGEAVVPMIFELATDSGSQWAFSFVLPTVLTGTTGGVPSPFEDSSGYYVQGGQYFNANTGGIFAANSQGKITIGIGSIFAVPVTALSGDIYYATVVCLATRMRDTITRIQSAALSVTIAGGFNCCANVDCDVTNTVRGLQYNVIFDPVGGASVISPANYHEATTDLGFDISGDPGQNVRLTFTLPRYLTGSAGTIPISFGTSSAVRIEDGTFFNPTVPNTLNTGTGGVISLRLGFSFTVPSNALPEDTYAGTALCNASYVGISRSMYSFPDTGITSALFSAAITVTPSGDLVPRQFALYQNFPNPFNSTTAIRYDLPEASSVSLKIFDALGREITTLVKGTENAGTHTALWQAGESPSGVYFCRIRAGSFVQVKKLILAR